MDEFTMQIFLALAMFLTTAVAGFAPFKLIEMIMSNGVMSRRTSVIMSVLSCYAGGVFLATCFLDTLPHVNNTISAGNQPFDDFIRGVKIKKMIGKVGAKQIFEDCKECKHAFLIAGFPEISHRIETYGDQSSLFVNSLGILYLYNTFTHLRVESAKSTQDVKCFEDFNIKEEFWNVPKQKEMKALKLGNGKDTGLEQEAEPLEVFQAVEARESEYCNGSFNTDVEKLPGRARSNSIPASSIIQSITFTLAMSFHSVLEGVALGVQDEKIGIITLFISLLLHKGIEAFSVGLQISKTIAQQVKMVIVTIIIYSLMTPVGSIAGLLLQQSTSAATLSCVHHLPISHLFPVTRRLTITIVSSALIRQMHRWGVDELTAVQSIKSADINEAWKLGTIVVLEALAIGAFIFVTFLEVLSEQRNHPKAVMKEMIAITLGVFTICGFQYFEEVLRGTDENYSSNSPL